MQVNWNGVYPAITTKFNEDESLDLQTYKLNLKTQLEAGIHGIVIAGTLGEASALKQTEKIKLLEATLEVIGNKIPIIVNVAEKTTKDAIQAAQNAQENGASGLMLLPPMQYKADDRETVTFYKSVAKSTDLPILVYNNPVDYGIEVKLEMFEELIKYENIQAVKDSTRDVTNVIRIKNRFGERIKIMPGVDTLVLEELLMGADGWISGMACAFPHEAVAIYELVQDGRIEEARKIYKWFMPLLELDLTPKLVQNIKMAEKATGIGTEFVRTPRLTLTGKERENVETIISKSLANRPTLPNFSNSQNY